MIINGEDYTLLEKQESLEVGESLQPEQKLLFGEKKLKAT
jgi:hypothetical protein